MALVQASIFSECLMRTIHIQAVIPSDKVIAPGMPVREKKPFKTLYLLNGLMGNDTDWVTGTRIERWAKDKDLAVIMPGGENRFYVDQDIPGHKYGELIGRELVELTRALFPLSDKREDTFIGGLSMGGYGALVNGLKYCDTFGYIAALSSALLLDIVEKSTYDAPWITNNRFYFDHVFGDAGKLRGSDKDYEALILKLKKENKKIPELYMAIGTEDETLLSANRDYHEFLKKEGVPVTYVEAPGAHEWDFWDSQIKQVLDWLPLGDTCEGLSSGHVTVD